MSVLLLDTNVLIALRWPNHVLFPPDYRWFSNLNNDQWATCPITECGFIRISSNRKFTENATTPQSAILLLKKLVEHPRHVFWQDSISLRDTTLRLAALKGHQQITDAYLLSLAIARGGRLVTFDSGIFSLTSTPEQQAAILLLPNK